MTIIRSRKARILEKAGLRYVAGWLPVDDAEAVAIKIAAAEKLVAAAVFHAVQPLAPSRIASAPVISSGPVPAGSAMNQSAIAGG